MNQDQLVIREIKDGEQKELMRVGRRAFTAFEALFVEFPHHAMAAVYEGKIVGGIIYKIMPSGKKKMAYIAEAFVDPAYHGSGVGSKLYAETFRHIWDQGCDGMTALVKDDNVASWKLFMENGFQRTGFHEVIRQTGLSGMFLQYLRTPVPFAIGMDFYMAMKEEPIRRKRTGLPQLLYFFLANLLLLLPIWAGLIRKDPGSIPCYAGAYATVLALFILPRYAGTRFSRHHWEFRLNNGGGFLTILLSIWGNTFPMNGNWYPDTYENTPDFRRDMAVPELFKWAAFSLAALSGFTNVPFFRSVSQFACYYLVFFIIPLYPFESLGAGRIYRYSKIIWLLTAILTVLELTWIFPFAS